MSAALRTKDGSFSVAKAILASERKANRNVLVTMEEALDWAHRNGVKIKRVKSPLDRINSHRAGLALPPFKLVKAVGSPRKLPQAVAKLVPPRPLVASEDELLDRIMTYAGTLTGLITPEIAGWLLKLNTNNRPLERNGVERFCKILTEGKWINTGEPVIVSNEGVLNDGQHRLTAIHTSGVQAEVDVRFGIIREAFPATGTGRRRTAGQVLAIEGYSNTGCQAAIARLLIHYDKGEMGTWSLTEPGAVLQVVDADDRICEIAARIKHPKFRFPPTRTAPFGFVLAVAARTAPFQKVVEFADLVSGGWFKSDTERGPTSYLHEWLSDMAMRRGERLPSLDVAILTAKTWNSWASGEPLGVLRVLDTDRTGTGFPLIREWSDDRKIAA